MTPKLFTALTLATAAATGITALALHPPGKAPEHLCVDIAPIDRIDRSPDFHYVVPHAHFARPPAPEPLPMPSPAPVA